MTAGNLSEAEVVPHSESLGQLRLKGIQPPARITLLCAPTPTAPCPPSKDRGFLGGSVDYWGVGERKGTAGRREF